MSVAPVKELKTISQKDASIIGNLLSEIAIAILTGDDARDSALTFELAQKLQKAQGVSFAFGAKRVVLKAKEKDIKTEPEMFAKNPIISSGEFSVDLSVPFDNAINAVLRGEIFDDLKEDIQKIYGNQSLPNYANTGVLNARELAYQKAKEILLKDFSGRLDSKQAAQDLKQALSGWSTAYGDTAYRTLAAKAYNNGAFHQLNDPIYRLHVMGVEIQTVKDSSQRLSHRAWDGIILAPSDPVWSKIVLPWHYNCRCTINLLSQEELYLRYRLDSGGRFIPERSLPQLPPERFSGGMRIAI